MLFNLKLPALLPLLAWCSFCVTPNKLNYLCAKLKYLQNHFLSTTNIVINMLIWGFDYKQNNPVFLRENGWRLTTPLLIIYPHNQVLHHGVNLKLTYRYYLLPLWLLFFWSQSSFWVTFFRSNRIRLLWRLFLKKKWVTALKN